MSHIIFVTGTDTGAGKTLATALLLHHLRAGGVHALALKPFCSGDRGDLHLLQLLQPNLLPDEVVTPWFFRQPVAPRLGLRTRRMDVLLPQLLQHLQTIARQCEVLLVEGAGGLMAPLGEGYTALEVVGRLKCPVLLAARNRLGCINHVWLCVRALRQQKIRTGALVLMNADRPDYSSRGNATLIAEDLAPFALFSLPWLGADASTDQGIRRGARKTGKTLSALLKTLRPDV